MVRRTESYPAQIRRIKAAAHAQTIKELRRKVLAVMRELGQSTPVKTGLARGNWQVGLDVPPSGTVGLRSFASMMSSALAKLMVKRIPALVYVVNNIDYVAKLNAGSSRKAPAGFVQAAINRGLDS